MTSKRKRSLRLLGVIAVNTVVGTLHLLDQVLDGLGLRLPLLDRHLLLFEHPLLRHAVGATETVKGSEELAVVDLEARVVKGVAGSTVDNGVVAEVLAIVDEDGPEVDEDEEEDADPLLHGEEEGENVVWQTLETTVDGMESVAGEGSGHNPLVVSLVKVLVDARVVQVAVNPVDAEVAEDDEGGELEDVPPEAGALLGGVVELAVATDFGEEDGGVEDGHDGHGLVGLDDLEPDLVLDVLGVVEGALVEDELVGQRGEDEVEQKAEPPGAVLVTERVWVWTGSRGDLPGDEVQARELAKGIISWE